jgi:predicted peroxiredoxin
MKKTLMKALLGTALLIPAVSSANEKNLMVVVTSGDSMTQLMSMVLGTQSKKQGANVDILFCGKAADLVVKGSQEVKFKPKGMSPQMLLNNLIKNGANVEVCPPYLPNSNKTKADLISGVKVAKPPMVAKKLLDDNTKILSY